MRGPIDFVVIGFEGNKFNGSILKSLADALEKGIIGLIDLSVVSKDSKGKVTAIDITNLGEEYMVEIAKFMPNKKNKITKDDTDEISELLENNTTAGLLIVEHLWAIPLKNAIKEAGGELITDGRIHPDAAAELN